MNRTHLLLDGKHKHMMKSGAPPDKVGVQYHLFTGSMVSQTELFLRVISFWLLVLSQFLETVWVPFN